MPPIRSTVQKNISSEDQVSASIPPEVSYIFSNTANISISLNESSAEVPHTSSNTADISMSLNESSAEVPCTSSNTAISLTRR